jgi:hypothetical protein
MKAYSPNSPLKLAKPPISASTKKSTEPAGKKAAPASGDASGQTSIWKTNIETSDAQSLWRSLNRLVSAHPMVRSALAISHSSGNPASAVSLVDMTQDLYLLLLQKGRFNHYLRAQMSDAEIEREIFQIELTNMLIGNLRRRRPENYRIARRIGNVLDNDPQFRQFKQPNGQSARYRQAAEAVYGLSGWSRDKPLRDSGTFHELINHISMRMRNRRRAGCTGDSQVIVSNQELAELMVEILESIDSPAPLRVLRQLALSKLPVCDPEMTSIDDDSNDDRPGGKFDWVASSDASPEQLALCREQEIEARSAATAFLDHLSRMVRSNPQRTERLWRVLWHCYFDSDDPSQLEIAEMVGISDSSVSDYRRKLEAELRKLDFTPDQLHSFSEELDEQLRWRLSLPEKEDRGTGFESETIWSQYNLSALAGLNAMTAIR